MSVGALTAHRSSMVLPQDDATMPSTVWGLAAPDLHDGYWASQGVQVVRPGARIDRRGPRMFMLLRFNHAVMIDLKPILRRTAFMGHQTIRVRITDRSRAVYRERVRSDGNGRLLRIERVYPQSASSVNRAVITTDAALAARWAALPPGHERWTDLAPSGGRLPAIVADGLEYDLAEPGDAASFITRLQRTWRVPGRLLPDVYEYSPGVWVHESAVLADTARLVGPLWIGAGQRVEPGSVVVGPAVLGDDAPCAVRDGFDWEALDTPAFPLVPPVRRRTFRQISKRLFDVAMSLGVLVATAPLYPIVMLLIYREDGRPFFFAHTRQTVGGRTFPCYKFRTMVKNAEQIKASLKLENMADGPQFFMKQDPRLLKIGGLLRRTQIDELPQFLNVLLGHMSVVGPRPSPDKENQFCPAWREARLSIRPGITGLWQVRRTRLPETDFQEWIRYDLEYVQRQSWRMDIWIILQTVRKVISG